MSSQDINVVVVSGHITRDPDLRSTASGIVVLSFGIAVNERVKDRSGEWTDRANFFEVTLFGNRADSLSRYLAKGMKVSIQGRLRFNQWEQDGQKRSKVDIVADSVALPPKQASYSAPQPAEERPADASVYDEDIPF